MTVSRRDLFKLAAAGAVGVAGLGTATIAGSASGAAASAKFARPQARPHLPRRDRRGQRLGRHPQHRAVGLMRTYYQWGDGSREDRNIKADHAAGRMPWISFKPQSTRSGGWAADRLRQARRRHPRAGPPLRQPVQAGHRDVQPRAPQRQHRVAGGLRQGVVPHPRRHEERDRPQERRSRPRSSASGSSAPSTATATRAPTCPSPSSTAATSSARTSTRTRPAQGYDVRLAYILSWLDKRGHSDKAVGVGETGCTNDFGNPNAVTWWTNSWNWAAAHSSRVCAIAYYNSARNNTLGKTWPLTSRRASWRPSRRA